MNILMLGWELPPHNSGGLGVACYQMSKALSEHGATIDFVVPYTASHPGTDFMSVYCVSNLLPLYQFGLGAYDSQAFTMSTHDPTIRGVQNQYGEFVVNHLKTHSYDAIHAHDWLTFEAGIRAKEITGLPLIAHVHATEFDRAGGALGSPLIHEIEENGLMMADRIIAVSNQTKQLIIQRYHIPAEKIEVMYNALDIESLQGYVYDFKTYRYLEHLKRHGYAVVTTVTRFTVQKGLVQFLRAAARASERYEKLVFLLVGDGDQRNELIALSAELGISDKVFFTGFIRGQVWRDAFSVADIFVMSSVSEPFGITALEATHHDCAVIVTKQSGVSEVLHSVLKYDFWDVDGLADRMVGIALSDTFSETLRHNASSEYSRLSWHDVARRCINLYRALSEGIRV